MIVYHGSTLEILHPEVKYAVRDLDFGRGFYVTTVKTQAERWAKRKVLLDPNNNSQNGWVNVYQFQDDAKEFRVKDFGEDLDKWLDFVCACRSGQEDYLQYDIIKGKVADDKVFRVVNMYMQGDWDKKLALEEMRIIELYNQIAIISQKAIDELLHFESSYKV